MNDLQAIEQVVNKYIDAIGSGDEQLFRSIWTGNDNTLISITKLFTGIDSITDDFLTGIIHTVYSSIKLVSENIDIHLINDHLAVVLFGYHTECLRAETLEPYGITGLETQIMVKTDNEWKLQHVHYSK